MQKNRISFNLDNLPYILTGLSIIIVISSLFFREKVSPNLEVKLQKKVKYVKKVEEQTIKFTKNKKESTYRSESAYTQYKNLYSYNPFKILIPRPKPKEKKREKPPLLDLRWAVRNWHILGPLPGIPEKGIPNQMLIEPGRHAEPIQVKKGDKITVRSRRRGMVDVTIKDIDLKNYTLTVSYFDPEYNQETTYTIKMF